MTTKIIRVLKDAGYTVEYIDNNTFKVVNISKTFKLVKGTMCKYVLYQADYSLLPVIFSDDLDSLIFKFGILMATID